MRAVLTFTIETDLAHDAIADLHRIREALFSRHGERFRDLARRIDSLADGGKFTMPEPAMLSEGHVVFGAPPEFTALIAEARALGVI